MNLIKKRNNVFGVLLFILFIGLTSCKKNIPMDLSKESIIPKPVSVTASNSSFELEKGAKIYVSDSAEVFRIGEYFAKILNTSTGFGISVEQINEEPEEGNIYLSISDKGLGEEGYELNVTEDHISLNADKPAGLIRAIQTLRQILPAKIESSDVQSGSWRIATGTIKDYPDYSYRGAMLDVCRHFFSVDDVKRYIDLLAYYKMNVLHLHLSDDQGWRIEIKSWPNLTTHGGSTQVGGGEGGFYTQEQYKEIVEYAQERYITIIPEIDMPGHTNAALASYPELNCNDKATELYTGTEVGFSTLCIKKDITYKFVDDVVSELAAITPGPYIHIGGDESHVTAMEDYIPFINKVQDIVQSYNKIMIGWDEVAHAKLKANSIVQFWAKKENALKGVNQGAKVIMSPAVKAYLDMQYDSTTVLGLHWAAYIEVDSAYIWDPATFTEGITKENILGIEAPLWSETIVKMDDIEYMTFPRLPGLAEVGWTVSSERNWDEYKIRLGKHAERFDALGINYYKSKLVPWVNKQ
ncbi:MAG: beta-N-acetylhexosaminidase [Bacteroidota bacterium]